MTVTSKRAWTASVIFLALTILAAAVFILTFYCGIHRLYTPLWGHIVLALIPVAVFFFLWHLTRRVRWNGAITAVLSVILAIVFILFSFGNLLVLSLKIEEMPKQDAVRTAGTDRRILRALSEELHVDMSGGTVVLHEDTHGGFHGDGETFCTVTFASESAVETHLSDCALWSSLPLTDNLYTAAYSLTTEDAPFFPTIENGYYYFCDRHPGIENDRDDSALLNRGSYNFTLAIYDTDSHTLYYYQLDT